MIPPVTTELVMSVAPVPKHTELLIWTDKQRWVSAAGWIRHCAGGALLNGNCVRLVRLSGSSCTAAFRCSYPFSFI